PGSSTDLSARAVSFHPGCPVTALARCFITGSRLPLRHRAKISWSVGSRRNAIVPFTMELALLDTDLRQIFVTDLDSCGIFARVQFGLDCQAGFGRGVAD